MPGLKLKLKPQERVYVNGAIIKNGGRTSEITIETPNTNVLRYSEVLLAEEATTPLRKTCFKLQGLVTGEANTPETRTALIGALETLRDEAGDAQSEAIIEKIIVLIGDDHVYKALRMLRQLIDLTETGERTAGDDDDGPGGSGGNALPTRRAA